MLFGWSPAIGDPGILGWAITAAYLVAAACAGRAAGWTHGPDVDHGRAIRERRFWLALAVLLVGLGINKELDLQSLLIAGAKHFAQQDGWYADRRGLQRDSVIGLGIGVLVLLGWLAVHLRRVSRHAQIAALGMVALIAFVLIRIAYFQHIDVLAGLGLAGQPLDPVLELGALAVIASAAALSRPD